MLFGNEKNPKGPNWNRARKISKDLSGTWVSFEAPPVRPPIYGQANLERQADSFNLENPETYTRFRSNKKDTELSKYEAIIWSSGWSFTGRPFLDGRSLGNMMMHFNILETRNLPVNSSLFRRRDLTYFAQDFFHENHLGKCHKGHAEDQNPFDLTKHHWPDNLGPINSQWLDRNDGEWLYFEMQPLRDGADRFYWLYPLGHQRCLCALFMVSRSLHNAGNPYRRAIRSPITNYRQLMENIMGSMEVELSEEAKAERQSIHNADGDYPLPHCTEQLVTEAKHTLYMWSGKGYREKGKPLQGDYRAPKEDVAAFIDERIKPRPLPGNLAIGPAFVEGDEVEGSQVNLIQAEGK